MIKCFFYVPVAGNLRKMEICRSGLLNARFPLPEGMKAIEYYYLLGRHKLVVIAEAPEPYLEFVFGDEYRLYDLTVPRYVGLRSRDSEGEE